MINNQFNTQLKRNPGNFSISDNKLRIQNSNGQSSILFEDISSITWKKISIPNLTFIMIGIFILFFGMMIVSINTKTNQGDSVLLLFIIVGIGFIVYGYINKIIWEDVIVETRGGMLLSYSVDQHKGQIEVNRIENARRDGLQNTSNN
ncbi:MAG: hypothetical protein RLZZ420_411 [Bacteroidota bacterium]|jgi:hypothetical protein